MEHRYGQRVNNYSQVLIYERGMPVSTGVAINSSRYGFFVKTNHPVMEKQLIEIEIVERTGRRGTLATSANRMKCVVVHSQENGFGVEIDELNINEFSAIASMRTFVAVSEKISTH